MSEKARGQRWDLAMSVEERRDEILRTLAKFLRERHLSALKMQDIADRLGMTKGNLYYYFKSKHDILFHCHMKAMEHSLAALDEVLATPLSPGDKLHTLLVRHVRGITDEAYGAVLLTDLENLTRTQRRRYVALRDRFEQGGAIADRGRHRARRIRRPGRQPRRLRDPWLGQLDFKMV
jgi:AcrR family transcriptional regulator